MDTLQSLTQHLLETGVFIPHQSSLLWQPQPLSEPATHSTPPMYDCESFVPTPAWYSGELGA